MFGCRCLCLCAAVRCVAPARICAHRSGPTVALVGAAACAVRCAVRSIVTAHVCSCAVRPPYCCSPPLLRHPSHMALSVQSASSVLQGRAASIRDHTTIADQHSTDHTPATTRSLPPLLLAARSLVAVAASVVVVRLSSCGWSRSEGGRAAAAMARRRTNKQDPTLRTARSLWNQRARSEGGTSSQPPSSWPTLPAESQKASNSLEARSQRAARQETFGR